MEPAREGPHNMSDRQSRATHLHQLCKVKLGRPQDLDLPDEHALQGVDALACLLNVLTCSRRTGPSAKTQQQGGAHSPSLQMPQTGKGMAGSFQCPLPAAAGIRLQQDRAVAAADNDSLACYDGALACSSIGLDLQQEQHRLLARQQALVMCLCAASRRFSKGSTGMPC